MPQKLNQTILATFNKGLITEANPLAFPDNASVDELNCELDRDVPRKRRKGFVPETNAIEMPIAIDTALPVHVLEWNNYQEGSSASLFVVQNGSTLNFVSSDSLPLSENTKSFTVDLNTYSAGNSYIASEERISGASIDGKFVVVSKALNPFFISYDDDTDTISTEVIPCSIRDFEWQGDTTTYTTNGSANVARKYDTFNAGWVSSDGTGNTVRGEFGGQYPALTLPWYAGKDSTSNDKFKKDLWTRAAIGLTSLIGNGRYVLDLWDMDRNAACSVIVSDELNETESERFSAVASFQGRVFFSGIPSQKNGSKVFFSRTIYNNEDYGKFYQVADPTAESDSDLVDTDGGVVNIIGAGKIKALFPWGPSLLVFADNGVWEIKGVDNVFKATEFAVSRIPGAQGLSNRYTIVDADGTPVYWSHSGIAAIGRSEVGDLEGSDLSRNTVQTLWDNIGADFRNYAFAVYESDRKRVFWIYGNDATNYYKYNKILILDTTLQAFVPWTVTDQASNTDYITGAVYFEGRGQTTSTDIVVDDNSSTVTASSLTVTVDVISESFNTSGLKFFYVLKDESALSVGEFTGTDFLDWGTRNYSSYAEAVYAWNDSIGFKKQNVYVTCVFKRTEDGWTGSESTGYVPTSQSSCTLKAYWDLEDVVSSSQQVYRLLTPIQVDPAALSTFSYPRSTIITKNKIRGRGRVLKLRFESEQGKDFQLYGYEVINAANSGF